MSDNTLSNEKLMSDLEILVSALQHPILYLNNFIDELINEIDIRSQIALNEEDTNSKDIISDQSKF